jgi:hypothetical protein
MPFYPLLFALALGQPSAQGQDKPALSVQVGVFAYRADGSTMASATTGGVLGPFEGNVFASSPCSVGSGSKEPPPAARNAWRITGQVIDISSDSAVVQLDWQRSKQSGEATASPAGSERLTLQNGTPVILDSVWADATGSCDIVRISLEVRLAPRSVGRGGGVGSGPRPGSGAASSGGGIGSGGGSGSGAGSGSGGGVRVGGASPGGASADSVYDVELWLVRQPPSGDEQVLQMKPRIKGDWARFTFPALTVPTSRGALNVVVGAEYAITTGTGGEKQLTFSTKRSVTFEPAGGNTGVDVRAPETSGGSETRIPMPGPSDVLAFEMPPLQIPAGGPALPDRLSVRVRIRPVQ